MVLETLCSLRRMLATKRPPSVLMGTVACASSRATAVRMTAKLDDDALVSASFGMDQRRTGVDAGGGQEGARERIEERLFMLKRLVDVALINSVASIRYGRTWRLCFRGEGPSAELCRTHGASPALRFSAGAPRARDGFTRV